MSEKRFLVVAHFRTISGEEEKLARLRHFMSVLTAAFGGSYKLAFGGTSNIVGVLLRTTKHAHAINGELAAPEITGGAVIHSGDELLVIEIGDTFSTRGMGIVDGWLAVK